jgi:iron complex transport system substrate-binding protein
VKYPIEISEYIQDQFGELVGLQRVPKRIVSLVPSLTEFLVDIGVGERLVGRTKFCIHPKDAVAHIPTFGGTKNPKVGAIVDAGADLVIMNREENRREDYEALAEHTKVLMTDILTVDDALREMRIIGGTVGCEPAAAHICDQVEDQLKAATYTNTVDVAYFIWREPWMVAGGSTYINDVLERFGMRNVFANAERYPEIQLSELGDRHPKIVLLSSEPYPFKPKHIAEVENAVPGVLVELVDGEWFSWYGSRMLPAFKSIDKWRKILG